MSTVAEQSSVIAKTKELCAEIAADPDFRRLQKSVETFLNDDAARLQYQSVHQRGEELHQKKHAGIELSASEVGEFEAAKESLFANEVALGFLQAQKELEDMQAEIAKYVGMTIELGRVPSDEEMEEKGGGGCCGGHDGGGCGCG